MGNPTRPVATSDLILKQIELSNLLKIAEMWPDTEIGRWARETVELEVQAWMS